MDSEVRVITESFVNVFISSTINSFTSEKRFPKDLTIADLKGKLELITGCSSGSMKISVHDDESGKKVCDLSDDNVLLGSYPIDSGFRLHVVDHSKSVGEYENTQGVQKFELSEEEYSKRNDTVQSFLKRNKVGKYNEEEMKKLEEEKNYQLEKDKELAAKMEVGNRCSITVPGNISDRRGEVKFIGNVHFKPGIWVGVQYDEPFGKNDGSVEGKRYFKCKDKYGGFVKICFVSVGDYPEKEIDLSDDEI
ncbi:tubulin-folding cofactor B-like [Lepeophtheirus salmonis]|uniref:tubulin-folding cofactor B-like n=1 Tax=Lepeophtheirus salmonis TaxID=72036 RepID=UPI001AE49B19|nr:tubulin-folding cofactor B-like [Lepeophtheirus salmonis]